MYVVPTPYRLVEGVAHQQTLILPADASPGEDFVHVGDLARREAAELIAEYTFDLKANELHPTTVPNPGAGREHCFRSWRLVGPLAGSVCTMNARGVAVPVSGADDHVEP